MSLLAADQGPSASADTPVPVCGASGSSRVRPYLAPHFSSAAALIPAGETSLLLKTREIRLHPPG